MLLLKNLPSCRQARSHVTGRCACIPPEKGCPAAARLEAQHWAWVDGHRLCSAKVLGPLCYADLLRI